MPSPTLSENHATFAKARTQALNAAQRSSLDALLKGYMARILAAPVYDVATYEPR